MGGRPRNEKWQIDEEHVFEKMHITRLQSTGACCCQNGALLRSCAAIVGHAGLLTELWERWEYWESRWQPMVKSRWYTNYKLVCEEYMDTDMNIPKNKVKRMIQRKIQWRFFWIARYSPGYRRQDEECTEAVQWSMERSMTVLTNSRFLNRPTCGCRMMR